MNVLNFIIKKWQAYKAKSRLADIERIKESFSIREKNGALWIMYNNTAIDSIPPFASSEEVVRMLDEARCCAVAYYNSINDNANIIEKALGEYINE